jgi:uncharacterized protein YceK
MRTLRRKIVTATLATLLITGLPTVAAANQDGFNDQYVFATTKSVNRMDNVNPALKLTLFPLTVVLDTVLLPFALIAGLVS